MKRAFGHGRGINTTAKRKKFFNVRRVFELIEWEKIKLQNKTAGKPNQQPTYRINRAVLNDMAVGHWRCKREGQPARRWRYWFVERLAQVAGSSRRERGGGGGARSAAETKLTRSSNTECTGERERSWLRALLTISSGVTDGRQGGFSPLES